MDIKNMQSFKEFLKEEEQTSVELLITCELNDDLIDNEDYINLKKEIIRRYPQVKVELDQVNYSFDIRIENLNSSTGNLTTLEKLNTDLYQLVEKWIEEYSEKHFNFGEKRTVEDWRTILISYNLPSFVIEWNTISIILNKETTLQGIDKMIGECEEVNFYYCEKITGNVLGLMKLKCSQLYLNGKMGKWESIVNKHFRGDKDILDCQEDLISAGFKNYAKF